MNGHEAVFLVTKCWRAEGEPWLSGRTTYSQGTSPDHVTKASSKQAQSPTEMCLCGSREFSSGAVKWAEWTRYTGLRSLLVLHPEWCRLLVQQHGKILLEPRVSNINKCVFSGKSSCRQDASPSVSNYTFSFQFLQWQVINVLCFALDIYRLNINAGHHLRIWVHT